jgi:mRNA-degrading endonuclease RelE of RelBE toxin-antitoxin system
MGISLPETGQAPAPLVPVFLAGWTARVKAKRRRPTSLRGKRVHYTYSAVAPRWSSPYFENTALFLTNDANVETRRRKPLRPNRTAQWELRIDDYRVFYDLGEGDVVKIVAVGYKEHNDLYIRGKKVEL